MQGGDLAAAIVFRRLDRNEIGITGPPPQNAEHGAANGALAREG
jgi:hypothetical protein